MIIGCTKDIDPQLNDDVSQVIKYNEDSQVAVKSGTFLMGTQDDSLTYIHEYKNIKTIELSDYHINKYEVTWFEYVTFLKDVGLYDYGQNSKTEYQGIYYSEDETSYRYKRRPALAVNWQSANDYCEWLGGKTGQDYSLPTEAQWEFAARSRGQKVLYAAGDGFKIKREMYMYGEWGERNKQTHDLVLQAIDPLSPPSGDAMAPTMDSDYFRIVGSYSPNPLGLYDMTGNAKEWVADWYDKEAYSYMDTTNPKGPSEPKAWEPALFGDEKVPAKTVRDWLAQSTMEGGVYGRGKASIDSGLFGFRCVKNIPFELPPQKIKN